MTVPGEHLHPADHSEAIGPWKAICDFGIHSFVGTSLFAVVATPAVGCDFAVKWLAQQQVSAYVVYGLYGAEGTLFACDLALFLTFLVRTSFRHARRL
jgi:hypothetical protein